MEKQSESEISQSLKHLIKNNEQTAFFKFVSEKPESIFFICEALATIISEGMPKISEKISLLILRYLSEVTSAYPNIFAAIFEEEFTSIPLEHITALVQGQEQLYLKYIEQLYHNLDDMRVSVKKSYDLYKYIAELKGLEVPDILEFKNDATAKLFKNKNPFSMTWFEFKNLTERYSKRPVAYEFLTKLKNAAERFQDLIDALKGPLERFIFDRYSTEMLREIFNYCDTELEKLKTSNPELKQGQERQIDKFVLENQPVINQLLADKGLDKVPTKDRRFFYKYELLKEIESLTVEYKNYQVPFDQERLDILKKTMCAYLNRHGGRIYIGVDDQQIVRGSKLLPAHRDALQRQLLSLMKTFSPSCYNRLVLDLHFIPIRNFDDKPILGYCIVKIIIKQGDRRKLYSLSDTSSQCYIRNNGENSYLKYSEVLEFAIDRSNGIMEQEIPASDYKDDPPEEMIFPPSDILKKIEFIQITKPERRNDTNQIQTSKAREYPPKTQQFSGPPTQIERADQKGKSKEKPSKAKNYQEIQATPITDKKTSKKPNTTASTDKKPKVKPVTQPQNSQTSMSQSMPNASQKPKKQPKEIKAVEGIMVQAEKIEGNINVNDQNHLKGNNNEQPLSTTGDNTSISDPQPQNTEEDIESEEDPQEHVSKEIDPEPEPEPETAPEGSDTHSDVANYDEELEIDFNIMIKKSLSSEGKH